MIFFTFCPICHYTISPSMEMCPKNQFNVGQFHHITITPYNYFTISTYVRKIIMCHYTIWKMKKSFHHFTTKPYQHIPIILPYHHFTIYKMEEKSLHHFTTEPYRHIPIILPYHHFIISWFHRFMISPRWYNCKPMQYIMEKQVL